MVEWKKMLFCVICFVVVMLMPIEWIPLAGINIVQQRLLAIFVLAALLWVLEPIPVFATSLLIISLLLTLISNQGLAPAISAIQQQDPALLLHYKSIFAAFSSPIIILFLGGFALAVAATKYELDINLARVLLKPFGTQPKFVMLGLMLITAVFSMFMSNTATTVMMLAILAPVLSGLSDEDPGVRGLVLAVPVAANVGGIGTPIGTPPNAIALQYLVGEHSVSFGTWMAFAIPFVIVMLAFAWVLLQKLFPTQSAEVKVNIDSKFRRSPQAWIVYITFATTILLWLTTKLHGMNAYVVAILPLTVFTMTRIITKEDLKKFNWDVIWLVAGGIAIGAALENTGLASSLAHSVDYSVMTVFWIIVSLAILCWMMANFMSNTATANLLMPIAAAMATTLSASGQLEDVRLLLIIVAMSASMGMVLPVSTPPNALAYASGKISNGDMAKVGVIVSSLGILILLVVAKLML
ncbi:SLC13/DASS family transporter [Corallincola luteus]|uniref:SLC13/DASS family transporter n=1 Tax=Corallincola luteus TaxID=1775177 RepID=A0ABY2AN97_9GAMM|nr:SLC13 family permease [Corallincola luteus]TCI04645.1 SLC13/DASS family transporter [Corallincola luteus]